MKKRNSRLLACALAVVLCMTAFSIPTFAAGYYASNENGNNTPPDAIESITVSTENVNLPANSSSSGIPALTIFCSLPPPSARRIAWRTSSLSRSRARAATPFIL